MFNKNFEKLNPFFYMTFLYFFLGILMVLQTSLLDFGILDNFTAVAISWVRIHFITLGILTQLLFGYLPGYLSSKKDLTTRWDIWLLINTGLFTFFYGRSLLTNAAPLMIFGGLLIFSATLLFIIQLLTIREDSKSISTYFYAFAGFFLLIGIVVGVGIWAGWGDFLQIKNSLEVHIHANNWGFMNLVFTGLLIDVMPILTNKDFKWPNSIKYILVSLILGAIGLIIGPWVGVVPITVSGMIFFLI